MSEREELLALADRFDRDPVSWAFSNAMTRAERQTIAGVLRRVAQARQEPTREGCILCANGNDLPEGEQCAGCGREGHAVGLRAAVIKARGRAEPPSTPVHFAQAARRDPEVVAAVQEALMRHPRWNPGLGSSAFAFGLANTAIDAYRTAMTSNHQGGTDV